MLTIDSSLGANAQAPPLSRLLFFEQHFHKNRRVPLKKTLRRAIERNPRKPFSSLASGFLRNTSQNRSFPVGKIARLLSNQASARTPPPWGDGEIVQHLCGPVALFFIIFPRARRTLSDGYVNFSSLPSNQVVFSALLISNPFRLHLRGWHCSICRSGLQPPPSILLCLH